MLSAFRRRRPATPLSPRRVRLNLEQLESRITPSAFADMDFVSPMVVAGDDTGTPPDSTQNRVDANTTSSYFSGVGSVQVVSRRGTYIGTGSVLTDTDTNSSYVLTAGHVLDINGDGKFSSKDGVTSITFYLNYGSDLSHAYTVSGTAMYTSVSVNPNYSGFNKPSVNDDLAVIRFSGSMPDGVRSYSIYSGDITHHVITMVGYGRSGNGDVGYTTNASWSIKRVGQNVVDNFYGQDDAGQLAANEVFRYDFDGPTSSTNYFGDNGSANDGLTLGNDVEATIGGGDSGGPSFVWIDGVAYVAGVNTFSQGVIAPRFGSLGGGIVIGPYVNWLQSLVPGLSVANGTLASAPAGISGTGNQASLLIPADTTTGTKSDTPTPASPPASAPKVETPKTTVTLVPGSSSPSITSNSTSGPAASVQAAAVTQEPVRFDLNAARTSNAGIAVFAAVDQAGTFISRFARALSKNESAKPLDSKSETPAATSPMEIVPTVNAEAPAQTELNAVNALLPDEIAEPMVGEFQFDTSKSLGLQLALALLLSGGCYRVISQRRKDSEELREVAV